MEIFLNQVALTIKDETLLLELLADQKIKPEGIAIAINNRIIKRDLWSATPLESGDKVTVIRATYGG